MIFENLPFRSIYQTATRGQALDTLPAIDNSKSGIFIKPIETEEVSWRTFLNPLSDELWITILIIAVVISCLLTGIELMFNYNYSSCLPTCTTNLWVALKANFGGKPRFVLAHRNVTLQIILFTCLLVGSIIWMAYRGSLTSELSVKRVSKPFDSLESLLESDYK